MGDALSDDAWITTLALAAGGGDRAALTTFIRATQRDVYRFLAHLSARDEAEDLTRRTYLQALKALPTLGGSSSARTWLLSIARRVAADHVRSAGTVEDWKSIPAQRSGIAEGALLRELVARLDADRRDAFVLTQVLGLDYAAAAEVCGCPVGTIRSSVARAREDLVRALNGLAWPGRSTIGP